MDDVHPDTTSRNVRDLLGGGEAWQKNQLDQFFVTHSIELGALTEPHTQRFVFDGTRVDPSPIIGNFNDDLSGFMPGAELQGGLDWFSNLLAHLRPFNAVIDAIAYQMRQAITNRFQGHCSNDTRIWGSPTRPV